MLVSKVLTILMVIKLNRANLKIFLLNLADKLILKFRSIKLFKSFSMEGKGNGNTLNSPVVFSDKFLCIIIIINLLKIMKGLIIQKEASHEFTSCKSTSPLLFALKIFGFHDS